jgi:hypothetical protein
MSLFIRNGRAFAASIACGVGNKPFFGEFSDFSINQTILSKIFFYNFLAERIIIAKANIFVVFSPDLLCRVSKSADTGK